MGASNAPVLVTAATGTVGGEVVRALLERGARVRVLVRSLERASYLPQQVERVPGDLRDRASLVRAVAGVRSVFWLAPHEPDKVRLAENIASLCEAVRVRLVYAGDHIDIGNRLLRRAAQWVYGRKYPHYASSFRVGERIYTSAADRVLLIPTTFAQNDELARAEILAGQYPLPYRRVTPVDVRDIGDAVARALTDPAIVRGAYALTGPEALTGEQCAAIWSDVLGRPVRYTGGDFAVFERVLERQLSGHKLDDFRKSYRLLTKLALPAPTPKLLAQTTAVLGRPPRSYREYVSWAAAAWQNVPASEASS